MKIVNAEWERRNLGVECVEITFEQGDDVLSSMDEIRGLTAEYQVLKIPANMDIPVESVQRIGFVFAEDLIEVEHDLHVPVRSPMHQRLYEATSYRLMNEEDKHQLQEEVKAGMFSTDRIAKDPKFGEQASAKRYLGWLHDLEEQGALFYVIRYKDDSTGFVVLQTKDGGKTYSSVLGGGYQKYRTTGMGIIQKEQEITKSLGGKKLKTHVSSNNPGQLKALVINGYVPNGVEHVFVRCR